jgi:hypothetical protein
MSERHVKLFKNGRNQAVRIPREFELPGEAAIKVGRILQLSHISHCTLRYASFGAAAH